MKGKFLFCVVTSAIIAVSGSMPQADELEGLFSQWREGKFTDVIPKLRAYRKRPYGRTAQVDYLLATSLCRAGDPQIGRRYYLSLLRNYHLPNSTKNQVESEMAECPASAAPNQIALASVGSAQAGYSGKMFYLDVEELSVAENVEVAIEISKEEFRRRLFKPAKADMAAAATRERIGSGKSNQLDDSYQINQLRRFVVVCPSYWDKNAVAAVGRQLNGYYDYYVKKYNLRAPEYLITAYLVEDRSEVRQIGRLFHGIKVPNDAIGYTFRNDFSVVAIVPRSLFLGTAAHELFHMLVRNDFGDIPAWLDEGIAALYETSAIDEDGSVRLLGNWRRTIMRESRQQGGNWSRLKKPAVSDLVSMSWDEFNVDSKTSTDQPQDGRQQQALNHATARSFILYLHEQEQLVDVFKVFRSVDIESMKLSPSAHSKQLLAKRLGKPIAEIDRDFEKWVQVYIER